MTNPSGENTIQAVASAFTILETIVELDGARITDLEGEIDLSKSTIHNHLQTLRELGYVRKEGNYHRIGMGLVTLGGFARDHHKLYDVSRSVVNRIADETGELALVTAEYDGQSMYLYQARGQHAVRTDSYLGIRLSMHCTGTGKAMLSQMDDERVEELVESRDLTGCTPNTITDPETLYEELDTIRETRVAYDDEERILGMRGIASPITDRNTGNVVGAISVTGPTSRVKGERFESELPELVKRAAEMIEVDYTYSGRQ